MARMALLALCAVLGNRAAAQRVDPLPQDFRSAYAVICPLALSSGGTWMRDPAHLSPLGFTLKSNVDPIVMAETNQIRVIYMVTEERCDITEAYNGGTFMQGWRQLAQALYPEAELSKGLAAKEWHPWPVITPIDGRSFVTRLGVTKHRGSVLPYLSMKPFKD